MISRILTAPFRLIAWLIGGIARLLLGIVAIVIPLFKGVFRLVGSALLVAAVVLLVYDGTLTLSSTRGVVMTSLQQHWSGLAPQSLRATEAAVRRVRPEIWDQGVRHVIGWPAWASIGGLAVLLLLSGRRRREVNVFAN